jgi:sugar lactone lactonase YvrE
VVQDRALTVMLDSLAFPECPRWHEGRLWFSDMHDRKVWAMTQHAQSQLICEVAGQPSGLGWLPDGSLQIVSMTDRKLLRLQKGYLLEVADLTPFFAYNANDMVMDSQGRAYIGSFGFDLDGRGESQSTSIVCVEPDGEAWVVIEGLLFPNGSVFSEDGRTLIVAESFGQRLSAYDVNEDGSLANPRVWADLRPNVPDGICMDIDGAVWVADPVKKGIMRVLEGGAITDWISTGDRGAYACALGGSDMRSLFICTAESSNPARTVEMRSGRIEMIKVEVPGPETSSAPPGLGDRLIAKSTPTGPGRRART